MSELCKLCSCELKSLLKKFDDAPREHETNSLLVFAKECGLSLAQCASCKFSIERSRWDYQAFYKNCTYKRCRVGTISASLKSNLNTGGSSRNTALKLWFDCCKVTVHGRGHRNKIDAHGLFCDLIPDFLLYLSFFSFFQPWQFVCTCLV